MIGFKSVILPKKQQLNLSLNSLTPRFSATDVARCTAFEMPCPRFYPSTSRLEHYSSAQETYRLSCCNVALYSENTTNLMINQVSNMTASNRSHDRLLFSKRKVGVYRSGTGPIACFGYRSGYAGLTFRTRSIALTAAVAQ